MVTKHLHPVTATAKGNIAQTRQHPQSTTTPKPIENSTYLDSIRRNIKNIKANSNTAGNQSLETLLRASIDAGAFPPADSPNIKTKEGVYALFDSSPKGLAYIDLIGRFPYRSARGNEYILVGYHYDDNDILVVAL